MKKIFLTILLLVTLFSTSNIAISYTNIWFDKCIILAIDDWDTADFSCLQDTGEYIDINNIRFAGIDSPDFHPGDNEQCYYKEARDYMITLKDKNNIYSINFLWKDLCKDNEKWCRPVWIITNNKTNKSIWEELTKKWFAFYWLNDIFNIPKSERIKLIRNVLIAKYKKLWLWWKCEIIHQEENLNIWNSLQAIPPMKTNYIAK